MIKNRVYSLKKTQITVRIWNDIVIPNIAARRLSTGCSSPKLSTTPIRSMRDAMSEIPAQAGMIQSPREHEQKIARECSHVRSEEARLAQEAQEQISRGAGISRWHFPLDTYIYFKWCIVIWSQKNRSVYPPSPTHPSQVEMVKATLGL